MVVLVACYAALYTQFVGRSVITVKLLFSHVLRDSTTRLVGPSVGPSVRPSVRPSITKSSVVCFECCVFELFEHTAPAQMTR